MAETLPVRSIDLAELGADAADFAAALRSAATDRACRSDWADFIMWCQAAERIPLPADPVTVGAYLTDRSGVADFEPQRAVGGQPEIRNNGPPQAREPPLLGRQRLDATTSGLRMPNIRNDQRELDPLALSLR